MFRILVAILIACAGPAAAEAVRVAAYNVELTRNGAGVLLADLGKARVKGPDAELAAVLAAIRAVRPDVLVLARFDHDLRGRALDAFRALLAEGADGIDYGHAFSGPVNAGAASGRDLDGDGLLLGPTDAWGWGRYPGHGGLAVLSRLPIDVGAVRAFRELRWADLPGAVLPALPDGTPWPDAEGQAALRLSSRAHWDVPVVLPGGGRLHVLASNPTPPLFDGPEELNRRRNRDEVGFWSAYLSGQAFRDDAGRVAGPPEAPVVVLGDLQIDPADGSGFKEAIAALLAHPRLRDPEPASEGAVATAAAQGGSNRRHGGPAALDTADWKDERGPGNLRVDYVLPDRRLKVAAAGVFWPGPGEPLAQVIAAGPPHRLVWVDVVLP